MAEVETEHTEYDEAADKDQRVRDMEDDYRSTGGKA